jgi:hypothetical protein
VFTGLQAPAAQHQRSIPATLEGAPTSPSCRPPATQGHSRHRHTGVWGQQGLAAATSAPWCMLRNANKQRMERSGRCKPLLSHIPTTPPTYQRAPALSQLAIPSRTQLQHARTYSCVGSARFGSSHKHILAPWPFGIRRRPRSVQVAVSPCCPTRENKTPAPARGPVHQHDWAAASVYTTFCLLRKRRAYISTGCWGLAAASGASLVSVLLMKR